MLRFTTEAPLCGVLRSLVQAKSCQIELDQKVEVASRRGVRQTASGAIRAPEPAPLLQRLSLSPSAAPLPGKHPETR